MKKLIAILLSLALLCACAAVLAEADTVPVDAYQFAHYQFRNLTGDDIIELSLTDNKTGEVQQFLTEGDTLEKDQVLYLSFSEEGTETKEDLEHRYTLSFTTAGEYKAEFKTLSFENVLIDLLAADAVTGATPIKFNPKMFQVGSYKVINNTEKVLESVTITENADENNNSTVYPMLDPEMFCFVDFIIDPESEHERALTIRFKFADGTECSYGALSIEEASLTLTPDTVTGATPFIFGAFEAD